MGTCIVFLYSLYSAARKQSSAEKAAPGFDGCARTTYWPTSKAFEAESIQALIHPFSKIIREGNNCTICDYVTK